MNLTYNSSGKFRIIQFTDLHLGEYPFNKKDQETLAGIKKAVEAYNPDLLVFSGDIIYSMQEHGAPNPKESFKQFIMFANNLNTPYAVTFGNHDTEEGVNRDELRAIYDRLALNVVEKKHVAIIENRENYIIELYDSKDKDVKNIFYIIDSGDYSNTDHSYYAWILPEQISWFKEIAAINKGQEAIKKNLIFQHIPIPEYWLASQNLIDGNFNEDISMNVSGLNNTDTLGINKFPFKNGVFSPEINSGFFLELALNEEIWGMFVGHDHDNSFNGLYKGIHLVYGQSTGYNTYGSEPKGARIIDLFEKNLSIDTFPIFF